MTSSEQQHVLVVEPDDVTRKLISGILTAHGFGVYEAQDGDVAIAFLAKRPALIIVDADNDSPAILGLLHKLRVQHGSLPVVAMSGDENKESVREKIGIHTLSVMTKPVMPEKLLGNIQEHLIEGVEGSIASTRQDNDDNALKETPQTQAREEKRAEFMRRALDLAQENVDKGGMPFGAVLVRNGKIFAEAVDEVIATCDPTARAEIIVLRTAAQKAGTTSLEGCEMYCSCEPCPMCLGAMYWAKIDRVFYGCTLDDATACGIDGDMVQREVAAPEHKRSLPSKMFLHDEAKVVMDSWSQNNAERE